jgi:hypothetical protein
MGACALCKLLVAQAAGERQGRDLVDCASA